MQQDGPLSRLTKRELDALGDAALWHAKYRAADISERAAERSAADVVEREEYLDLISGLRKLGVRIAVPEALRAPADQAA